MSTVTLQNVSKAYDGNPIITDLVLTAEEGAFLSLLGASGCGKTTVLRLIAGLETPDSGRVTIGDRTVFDTSGTWVAPEDRRIGMVFQSYAVWPHMNVLDNIAYPLRVRRVGKRERRMKALEVLKLVGLDGLEDRKPAQLSGGQQQRVALARGLIMEPDVLLLDEPLSNLDAKLRIRMRADIRRIQRQTGSTVIYVTHDQDEALEISDRIVIMESGSILAEGSPDEVRDHPHLT